jgi:endonuclease/exonuclease/phosphatase family metal-dependent hydrolase
MRVATYNVRHARPPKGLARLSRLVAACRDLDADVIGLQEVDRNVPRSWCDDQPAIVAHRLGMDHAYGGARRPMLIGTEGNALLARGRIDDVEIMELYRSEERYRRLGLLAAVGLDACTISVAVTHLQNHEPEALDQLPVLLDALAERPEPRVLLGDLNIRRPRAEPLLTAAGYALPEPGPTVPAEKPVDQIDFVAVRGLTIVAAAVPEVPVSDHRPLVVDFTF